MVNVDVADSCAHELTTLTWEGGNGESEGWKPEKERTMVQMSFKKRCLKTMFLKILIPNARAKKCRYLATRPYEAMAPKISSAEGLI